MPPSPASSRKDRVAEALGQHIRRGRKFGGQVAWSFNSKLVWAVLQLAVLIQLARGLPPAGFAFAGSVNVALTAFVALNGLGLMRQLQYHRSLDPHDPMLAPLFAIRLKFTYVSAVLWFAGCVLLALLTRDLRFVAIMPTTIWLAAEQTTTVWNAISIADGRSQALMPSYLYRRVPVVVALAVAHQVDSTRCGPGRWASRSVCRSLGGGPAATGGVVSDPLAVEAQVRRGGRPGPGLLVVEVGSQIRDSTYGLLSRRRTCRRHLCVPGPLIRPMNLVTQATGQVAFPMLARRKVITMRQLTYGVCAATVPVFLVSVVVAACAPLIPHVVGEAYRGSVVPMQILSIAAVLTGAMTMLVTYLTARSTAATRAAGYATLAAGLLQIGLAVLGGMWLGAVGAAIGATLSQALLFVVLVARSAAQCRREQRERGSDLRLTTRRTPTTRTPSRANDHTLVVPTCRCSLSAPSGCGPSAARRCASSEMTHRVMTNGNTSIHW